MITIDPVARALVPVDSAAADALGAPNYDEFQSDREVWELIQAKPASVLRVTMPHCDVHSIDAIGEDDSDAALAHAAAKMKELIADPRTQEVRMSCGFTSCAVWSGPPSARLASAAWRAPQRFAHQTMLPAASSGTRASASPRHGVARA